MKSDVSNDEMERIKDNCARLAEDWENVQILVNRVSEDGERTEFCQWGAGNIFAREHHAKLFLRPLDSD